MSTTKIVKTTVVFVTKVVCGMNVGIIMTTIPAIEVRTSSNTAEMATVFIWVALATIAGASLIGPLFARINGMLLVSVCLVLMGIFEALAPTWRNVYAFQAMIALMVFFYAALISGCLSVNRNTWKTSAVWFRPVIQMTMLMNTLGTTIGTQLPRPFIADDGHLPSNVTINGTVSTQTDDGGFEPVQAIYLIVGALDVGMAIVCMLTCFWLSTRGGQGSGWLSACFKDAEDDSDGIQLIPDTPVHGDGQPSNADEKVKPCSRQGRILLPLIFIFHFVGNARDFSFNFLLFTYVYEYRGWSAGASATLLLIGKLLHFVVGAVMVPVSRWVKPTPMLIFDLVMLTISGVLMLMALSLGNGFVVAGVVFEAFGTSDHGTNITLLEETIHVVAPLMATFVAMSGFSAIAGFVVGTLLYYVGEPAYAAMVLVATSVCTALFIAYKVLSVRFMKSIERHHKPND